MICHHCSLTTRCVETRTRADGAVRRRYKCDEGHVSVTRDHVPVPASAHKVRGAATVKRITTVLKRAPMRTDEVLAVRAESSPTQVARVRKLLGMPSGLEIRRKRKAETRAAARRLRAQGLSLHAISATLHVSVKTVWRHCSGPDDEPEA